MQNSIDSKPGLTVGQCVLHGQKPVSTSSRRVYRALAAALAMALIAAVLFLGLITCWGTRNVTVAEMPKILKDHKFARYQVWQSENGTKVLKIFPHNCQAGPFLAPANEQALSLLAERGIPYRTILQGRDYGFNSPNPRLALTLMLLLSGGAILLLRLAVRGTIFYTVAFAASFSAVFLLVFGQHLRQVSAYPKLYVSTARIKVSEWSQPALPQAEPAVVTSTPVLEQAIKELDFVQTWGQKSGQARITHEEALLILRNKPWVEILSFDHAGVIELSVDALTPGEAAALANALAKSYCNQRNQKQVVAQVLNEAMPDPTPYPISRYKMELALRALAEAFLGLLFGLIAARLMAIIDEKKTCPRAHNMGAVLN